MATHGLYATGTGGTAAATKTKIGSTITLPSGGPWTIHHLWGQVVKSTTVPNEGTGGILTVDPLSGDLTPDPAPGKYPLIGACCSESANSAIAPVPLNLWPVNWQAAGKALIDLSYTGLLAITTGSPVHAGIIFGDSIPTPQPLVFCDVVSASWAGTAEQTVGTITLAEKATKIVGILADLNKGDAPTAGEAIYATIRLDSADNKIQPARYPCNRGFNASDGTAVGQAATPQSDFIPVDIPVVGGSRIDCYATSPVSVTGNVDIHIYIAYM